MVFLNSGHQETQPRLFQDRIASKLQGSRASPATVLLVPLTPKNISGEVSLMKAWLLTALMAKAKASMDGVPDSCDYF